MTPFVRQIVLAAPSIDVDAKAWRNAVWAAGGNFSAARVRRVSALIRALKAAGVWSLLDRLWLFAAENSTQALTDLVARATATAVNSPTFTADRGYAGGATKYIDSNFNPSTAGGRFAQNDALLFAWGTHVDGTTGALVGQTSGGSANCYIQPRFTDDKLYTQTSGGGESFAGSTDGSGLWASNRTASNVTGHYRNGASFAAGTAASAAPNSSNLTFLGLGAISSYPGSVLAGGIGSSLDAAKNLALYNALRAPLVTMGAV